MTRNGCAALGISGDLWGDVYVFSAPVPSLGWRQPTGYSISLARCVSLVLSLPVWHALACLYASPSPCLHLRRAPAHCRTYASLPTALWLSNAIYCIRYCRCGCVTACCTVLACVRLDRVGGWGLGAGREQEYAHPAQGASGRAVRRLGQAAAGGLPPQGRAATAAVQAAQRRCVYVVAAVSSR